MVGVFICLLVDAYSPMVVTLVSPPGRVWCLYLACLFLQRLWLLPCGYYFRSGLLVYGCKVALLRLFFGVLLRYLYLQQQLDNQQQMEMHYRLQALQSKIRPHFLFNSMNTIACLITIDPEAAETAVENLSQIFRASLQEDSLVTLTDELALCHHYIAIEQLRLAERLQMNWELPEQIPSINVPSLSIQPLLENAIVHGIQRLSNGGEVTLSIKQRRKVVQVTLINPISQQEQGLKSTDCGNGIALENIKHRLMLYYGDTASFDVNVTSSTYSVTLLFPRQ